MTLEAVHREVSRFVEEYLVILSMTD